MSPWKHQITPRQADVLRFMWSFYLTEDQLPTFAEICRHFDIYPNAATYNVQALEAKGYVEPNACPGRYRFTAKAREFLAQPSPLPVAA